MSPATTEIAAGRRPEPAVEDYLKLGLALGRHIDGLVDAYYGPRELADRASAAPPEDPARLVEQARRLLAELDAGGGRGAGAGLEAARRVWLAAQVRGLHTTARKLAGEPISYLDEIEASYGVRPGLVSEDEFAAAHARIASALPGSGDLAERYVAWREGQVVPVEVLAQVVESLADDFRQRTKEQFGLPEGEHVDFDLVTGEPWSGFNYYLGSLRSRVAINTDLPVPSPSVGALVAHEAYPGHHTEHCRKEAGLVRRRHHMEETIFLVGTPQCLIAEGLADLAIEVIAGRRPERTIAAHLRPLGVPYDADLIAEVSEAGETLAAVRGNAAILVHDRGMAPDDAVRYIAKWSMVSTPRAQKAVQFLLDPTWRAYMFCYIDGVRLCRRYVAGDPARFATLITEQMLPSELVAP